MTPLLIALLQAYANAEKAENILNGEEVVILNKRGFLEWLELLPAEYGSDTECLSGSGAFGPRAGV